MQTVPVDQFSLHRQQRGTGVAAAVATATPPNVYPSRFSVSEVMMIVIVFHGSSYRTFKAFYKQKVLVDWRDAFPNL